MRRVLIAFFAFALVFGGVACSEDQRDEAGEVADEAEDAARDAAEEGREVAEEGADAAGDAADRAEDVANDRNVDIDDNAYEPERLEIRTGTEVTWVNQDSVQHTVTSDNESFESEELDEGDEFSNRFTDEGEFKYHCEIHGEDVMSGTIVVTT